MNPTKQPIVFSRTEEIAVRAGFTMTSDGRVISPSGKERKLYPAAGGYYRLRISRKYSVAVHRLQAYIKFGDRIYQPGIQVRHLDGNSLNNSSDNIAIGTIQENAMDKAPDVRMRSALTAASFVRKHDHAAIIQAHRSGKSYKQIRRETGAGLGSISYIIRNSVASKGPQ